MRKNSFLLVFLFLLPLLAGAEARAFKFYVQYQGPEEARFFAGAQTTLLKTIPGLQLVEGSSALNEQEVYFQAQRWSCEAVLKIETSREDQKLKILWSLTTVQGKKPLTSGSFTKSSETWTDQAEVFWLALAAPLIQYVQSHADDIPKALEAALSRVRLQAVPGTFVEGAGEELLLVGPEGFLEVEMTFPASYTFQGSHPEFRTDPFFVFLLADTAQITLPQRPEKVWTVDASLFGATFPSASVSWFFLPGKAFVRGGFTQFFLGFNFNSFRLDSGQDSSLLTRLPLIHFNLGVGYYFNNPESQIRFYGVNTAFLRLITQGLVALEPIAPWGFRPALGFEYRPSDSLGIYAELGANFFVPSNAFAFESSAPDKGFLTTMLGPWIGVEAPTAELGFRFYF